MRLDALQLRDFRNLEDVLVEPHPRFNVLAGDNGQGKTNFLEAIHLLSAVESFRAKRNAELVRFDADRALLEARVDRGGHERIVRVEIRDGRKDVYLNETPVDRLEEFFGTVNVVLFGPQDMSLLKGSPSERRSFLDDAIFNAHPAYATELDHYDEVLGQRNSLLKQDDPDEQLLSVYDDQLVQYGAEVVARRAEFVDQFSPVLGDVFQAIFDPAYEASVEYDMKWAEGLTVPSHPPDDLADIELLLEEALEETAERERERGYTLVGPHRDDLAASLQGRPIDRYGSQGQHRAFILSMKVAVITYLRQYYHFAPILLLDDVSSELDRDRNDRLFTFLREETEGQVFITTTHRDYIPLSEDARTYDVEGGMVEEALER